MGLVMKEIFPDAVRRCDYGKIIRDTTLLKLEEKGYEPRYVGGLQNLEKARKWILPWSLQKGTQLC